MVNEKVGRARQDHSMHHNGFSAFLSSGVNIAAACYDIPLKFNQLVIIRPVNDSEFALCKRYPPGGPGTEFEICRRIEIWAGLVALNHPPSALKVGFLAAAKDRTAALADYVS